MVSISNKRKERDIMKLMMSNHEVTMEEGARNEFDVVFKGPKDSAYEGVSFSELKLIIRVLGKFMYYYLNNILISLLP
jgi:ubiquitin-protein ligase